MTTSGHPLGPLSPLHQSSTPSSSSPSKRDLKSWWKSFKLPSKHQPEPQKQGIFGVPLRQSITYANVAISLVDENGQSYIYGYVPIVVAKCGVFLKERATGVEGIFRLSGSEKRIKDLKAIFDTPDKYGKGLSWEAFTVHDAANVLRRYLNDLPEPVVPLDLYDDFRAPLRGATNEAVGDAEGPQFVENFDNDAAIAQYQKLITQLPPLNKQLLLYILDLLAVFAAKSDENFMNSQNLAAIFQPGMLSHPDHDMIPTEYRLNQCVVIFLIENQDHFLIGMQGTGTDEKTKQEIESGTPVAAPSTPRRKDTGIDRSVSNASAGAVSVRRDGQLRRNRSVSSKHSKGNDSTTPNSPALSPTPAAGGLARSNTVPSKKSPAVRGGKFRLHDQSPSFQSSNAMAPLSPGYSGTPRLSENSSLAPPMGPGSQPPGRSHERLLEVPQDLASSKERNVPGFFQRSLAEDKRQPNKLRKKRIPGSLNHSAQSSSTSLQHPGIAASPSTEAFSPVEKRPSTDAEKPKTPEHAEFPPESTLRGSHIPAPNNTLSPDHNTLKAKNSPSTSLNSSYNEGSDFEHTANAQAHGTAEAGGMGEKKRRWRMSRKADAIGLTSPDRGIRSNEHAGISTTSINSAAQRLRKTSTEDGSEPNSVVTPPQASHNHQSNHHSHHSLDFGKDNNNNKDDIKGPLGWIRNKMREAKETAEQRRNKSPSAKQAHLPPVALTQEKPSDIKDIKPEQLPAEKPTQSPRLVGTVIEHPVEEEKQATLPPPTALPPFITPVPAPVTAPATVPLAVPVPSSPEPVIVSLPTETTK